MARNTFIAVMMLVVAMCVNFSSAGAPLVRSAPQDQDRVMDFTISEARDSVSWTAFGREWTVRLELSDVMEDNTDYFHGTLQGDANAVVSFALLPGSSLSGMIGTSETTWWIRAMPVAERNYSEDEDDLGVFMVREHSSLQTGLPSFSAPLEPEVEEVSNENSDEEAAAVEVDVEVNRKRTINTYKVGVFHDQNWAGLKNPWRSRANTLALFNDVNAIYRASGLGQFTPVYLKQITNNQKSLNDMLNYFANTASKNIAVMADKSYTNYVWLVGTNVGGLAYVGTSCGNASQKMKTAVVGLVSYSRLWSVKTIAHELAHNRGAVHEFDNACTSSLTKNCQCSIMSYCFPSASNNPRGAVNFFSDTSINKMKSTGCH